MQRGKYIYAFSYDATESELCKLESRYLFKQEETNKLLFSDLEIEPSISSFIKKRLDIMAFSEDYSSLITEIGNQKIKMEGFKVEYLVFDGDTTQYEERLSKLKDIGYSIDGYPDYYKPTISYGLGYYAGVWYFGTLVKNNFDWLKHKQKPHSYSISISINIAKALVNIASKANKSTTILDACCGVGTIMLEACFAGMNSEGCDINWKVCKAARQNLAYFNYTANVYCSDVKDISTRYDAAIIDLPYNLFSTATDTDITDIIASTATITDRLIIVSTSDIADLIKASGFILTDYCSVSKKGKTTFARKIWVCERNVLLV